MREEEKRSIGNNTLKRSNGIKFKMRRIKIYRKVIRIIEFD